jgi:hypothetical protein
MPATAVPVVAEEVRWHDAHRIRWTPDRVEPQRVVLSCPQCRQATGPSRRFSIAPSDCIRISRDFSAARSFFSCGPVSSFKEPQSFLNSLTSMIVTPSTLARIPAQVIPWPEHIGNNTICRHGQILFQMVIPSETILL